MSGLPRLGWQEAASFPLWRKEDMRKKSRARAKQREKGTKARARASDNNE